MVRACASRSYALCAQHGEIPGSHIIKQGQGKKYPAFLPGLKYAVEIATFL